MREFLKEALERRGFDPVTEAQARELYEKTPVVLGALLTRVRDVSGGTGDTAHQAVCADCAFRVNVCTSFVYVSYVFPVLTRACL